MKTAPARRFGARAKLEIMLLSKHEPWSEILELAFCSFGNVEKQERRTEILDQQDSCSSTSCKKQNINDPKLADSRTELLVGDSKRRRGQGKMKIKVLETASNLPQLVSAQ
jgi:hypothetical protein